MSAATYTRLNGVGRRQLVLFVALTVFTGGVLVVASGHPSFDGLGTIVVSMVTAASAWLVIQRLRLRVVLDDRTIEGPSHLLGLRVRLPLNTIVGYRLRREADNRNWLSLVDRAGRTRVMIPDILVGFEEIVVSIATRVPSLDEIEELRSLQRDPSHDTSDRLDRARRTLALAAFGALILVGLVAKLQVAMLVRVALLLTALVPPAALFVRWRYREHATMRRSRYGMGGPVAAALVCQTLMSFPTLLGLKQYVLLDAFPLVAGASVGTVLVFSAGFAFTRRIFSDATSRAALLLGCALYVFSFTFASNVWLAWHDLRPERAEVLSVTLAEADPRWCAIHVGGHPSAPHTTHELLLSGRVCQDLSPGDAAFLLVSPGFLGAPWVYAYTWPSGSRGDPPSAR